MADAKNLTKRGKDGDGLPSKVDTVNTLSRARARPVTVDEAREKGKAVAAYLRADQKAFQEQAALAAGINVRTYHSWLSGSDETDLAFQAEVLPAVMECARKAEEQAEQDIGCTENGSGAWSSWWRWKLAQRYRKIFGDLAPQKVELTGKDGGPIELAAVQSKSDAELRRLALADDAEDGDE